MELTDAQKRIAEKYKPGQGNARAAAVPQQTVAQMKETGNKNVDRSLASAKLAERNADSSAKTVQNMNTQTKQRSGGLAEMETKLKAAETAYKNSPTLVNQLIYENIKKQYDNAAVLYTNTAERAGYAYDAAINAGKHYQTAVEDLNKTVDAENQKAIEEEQDKWAKENGLATKRQFRNDRSMNALYSLYDGNYEAYVEGELANQGKTPQQKQEEAERLKSQKNRKNLISQERFRNDRSLSELYALYEGDYDAYTRGELPMGSGIEQLKKDWEAFLASPDANDPAAIEAWKQKLEEAYAAAENPYDYIANRNFEKNAAIDPDRKDPKLARMQNEWDTLEYLKNDAASRAEQAKAAQWERGQEQSILDAGGEELLNNLLELDKVMKRIRADGAAGKTYSADIAEWERLEKLIAPYAGAQLSDWKEFAARRNNEQRYTDAQQRIAALTQKSPVVMNLARVPASLTSGIGMVDAGVQKLERILTGSDTPVDYKSAAQLPGMVSETVRDTTTGMIEEATKEKAAGDTAFGNLYAQAYQLGTSMLDSAAIVGLSMMGVPAGTLLLGGSAGNQAMLNAKERGADDWQALGVGVLAGAAEAVFEQVGIDNLTKNMKDATRMRHILRSAVKQAIPEATEEGLTTIANQISDRLIMGGLSEYETSIRKYMQRGMSREDAARQVNRETAITLATDVLGGAVSGGVFGTVAGTGNVVRQNLTDRVSGHAINRAGDETMQALLNAAGERGKNTESYKLAMKIGDRLTKGKRPSDLDIGRLQNALAEDVIKEAEQRAAQSQTQTEEEPIVYSTPKLPYIDNTKTTTEESDDEPVVHPPLKLAGPEQAGTFEDPAASALSPEQRKKYNAAGTETERTGILYGATQEQIDMAARLSDFTGREVLFYNREITPNRAEHGKRLGNAIYINTASQNPMAQIFAHELTHTIESANAYKGLSSAVFARMQQLGRNVDAEREKIMDMYRKAGVELTEEGANQELVAKFIESNLLTDEASIYDLVQRNPTIGRRILNWIDSVLARLGNKNAREREFLRRARSLYVSALRETDGLDQASRFGMARNRLQDDLTAGRLTEQEYDEAMDALSDTESMEGEGLLEQFDVGETLEDAAERMETIDDEDYLKEKSEKPFVLVMETTPQKILDIIKNVKNRRVLIRRDAMYLAVRESGVQEGNYHGLGAEVVKNIPQYLENPDAVLQTGDRNNRCMVFAHVNAKNGQVLVSVEFETSKEYEGKNEQFNIIVTIFDAHENYLKNLFKKHKAEIRYEKEDLAQVNPQLHEWLRTFNARSSKTSIDQSGETVKEQFSIGQRGADANRIAGDLRQMLNRGASTEELRRYVDGISGSRQQATMSRNVTPAERIVRAAHRQGLSVQEYLQQNWELYDVDGELNEDARKALELERGGQYSIGETETAEGTEEQAQSAVDTLPGKAKSYLEKAERTLTNSLSNALGVPWYAKREFLRPIVREISEEYLKTGHITQKTSNRLFETAYKNGMAANQEFYDQSRGLKDRLREQKLAVPDEVAAELPNYDMFRKFASKTLRIVSEGGMDVGQFYEQLTQEYPDIFPADITSSVEQLQRMYDVGQSIRKAEKALQEEAGPDAAVFKEWNKNDFQNAIGEVLQELQKVKRYADSKAEQETKAKTLESVEQVKELYPKIKEARDAVDKILSKTLLTDEDNMTVGRLLRGEILPEHVEADSENAKAILAVYEAKKRFEELSAPVREWNRRRKAQLRDEADRYLQTAIDWKDKRWGWGYSMETMERNIRDIVSDPILAEQIIKKYFTPVHEGAAAANSLKNRYRDEVRKMGISRKVDKRAGNEVSEAAAVQIYGEAMDNIRMIEGSKGRVKVRDGHTLDEWKTIVTDLWKNNPGLDQAKIEKSVEGFRKIYDELFEQMNEARIRNGYEPINYRKGYFPHFQAGDENGGLLGVFGKAFGISMDVTALPTTINGLTHTFKPGIQWFGHAQERTGFQTAFDAVEGFDKYIEGVADVICMTDQLQRLRALASQIRYRTTSEEIRKRVDKIKQDNTKTDQEKETLIEKEYGEGPYSLSKFVVNLEEYINILANKKSKFDRMMEENLSRNAYNVVKALESHVAANMVAINPASWLTNFIPLTQANAVLDRGALLHGMWDTLKNIKENDGFVDRSVFLTNRRGSDPLVRTWAQQTSAVLSKPMEWIDSLTADTIVRARYWQNMKHGMSEAAAMEDADAFAASVMADRSKGSTPTIFNRSNPVAKAFTQFQLEVNNQFRYLFKDVPRETRDKGLKMLAAALFKFFLGAWLYNEVYEFFIGRRPALDPIGILNDTVGDLTGYELPNIVGMGWDLIRGEPISFETERQGTYESMANLGKNVAEEVPFIGGMLGGGRVPISSALPDWKNLGKAALNEQWSRKKKLLTAGKELLNPVTYLLFPFGGGQAKKILQTAKAIHKDGVYTADAEGNDILQYPVHTDNGWLLAGTVIKGGLFGPTTLESGREWVESGFKNLSARETAAYQAMLEAGVDSRDAYDLIKAMKAEKNDDAKTELLKNAEISEAGKFALYYSVLATDREKNLLDQLSGSDADAFEATNVLMELEDARGIPGTAGYQAERNVILSSKMSDDAKAKVFYTMTASESNKTLMDEMADRGADFSQVAKAVMDIANTGTLYGAEKSNAKRNAIMQAELTDEEKKFLYRATFGEHYWDGSGERYYSSRDDEIAAFEEAGMSFDQFLQAQNAYSIINEEYHGAAEKATEFSKWVDQQGYKKEQEEVVKNSFRFYAQIAQSATKYETFTGAGLSTEKAYDLTGVLNALQPEAGRETVSTAQKVMAIQNHKGLSASEKVNAIAAISSSRVQRLTEAGLKQQTANKVAAALAVGEAENGEETLSAVDKARIIIDNTSGREETLNGLEAVLTESTYYKVEAAATYGSSAKDWVAFKEQYERKFGSKNASMERVEEILDAMNISVQSKAALWQICNKSWKPKNNPYNPLIGGKVQQELEKYSEK